jgi:hypothetical protein
VTTRRKIANKVLLELTGGVEYIFPSSDGRTDYHTRLHADGKVTCDCRGWTVKKGDLPRWCKHCSMVFGRAGGRQNGLSIHPRDGYCFIVKDVDR